MLQAGDRQTIEAVDESGGLDLDLEADARRRTRRPALEGGPRTAGGSRTDTVVSLPFALLSSPFACSLASSRSSSTATFGRTRWLAGARRCVEAGELPEAKATVLVLTAHEPWRIPRRPTAQVRAVHASGRRLAGDDFGIVAFDVKADARRDAQLSSGKPRTAGGSKVGGSRAGAVASPPFAPIRRTFVCSPSFVALLSVIESAPPALEADLLHSGLARRLRMSTSLGG